MLMESSVHYRWEASSGLEHTCWNCHLKGKDPKARQQCFGIHCIPCIRYHGTVFAIGRSHSCAACITADEVHDARHRKIAILVKEFKTLVFRSDTPELVNHRHGHLEGRFQNDLNAFDPEPRERETQTDEDDLENESSSLASTVDEHKHDTPSKAERRLYKKALKHEKSIQKSANSSERHSLFICRSDIDRVNTVLHGNAVDSKAGTGHPLANDHDLQEVIERNLRFVANIHEHQIYLRSTLRAAWRSTPNQKRPRKRGTKCESDDGIDEDAASLVNAVLLELGIERFPAHSVKSGRRDAFVSASSATLASILQRLRIAIREDLEKHENEQRETCVRAGGFWRYAGMSVFDRMTAIAQRIDWRTGEIVNLAQRQDERPEDEPREGEPGLEGEPEAEVQDEAEGENEDDQNV